MKNWNNISNHISRNSITDEMGVSNYVLIS